MKFIQKVVSTLIITLCLSLFTFVTAVQATEVAQTIISSTSNPSENLGEVSFTEKPTGLKIHAEFTNAPSGKHGFHVHENGSCADSGKAAGGHFNPEGVKHGYLPTDGFTDAHAGDLGNVTIAEDGTGSLDLTIAGLSLEDGRYAIANRAMILHEKEDDFGQPTGNAGSRIGCGVISTVE